MKELVVLSVVAMLWGCGNSVDPLKSGVQVSFATRNPALPGGVAPSRAPALASPVATTGDTISDGTNVLIIQQAQLVLKTIELERSSTSSCTVTGGGCESVAAGPVLVDLPLTAGAQSTFLVPVPPGSYENVKFVIHVVSGTDPAEIAFQQAYPDFVGKSIRVQGQYNGQPFTYQSTREAEQELTMSPAIVVTANAPEANLTIRLTISQWFRNQAGALLDPSSANKGGANESLVNSNIQNSMKAFEDKDGDGDERDG